MIYREKIQEIIKEIAKMQIDKNDKIYVAGHRGLVGSAIVRSLKRQGYNNIIGRTHKELDLKDQAQVREFFEKERPDVVVLAAAKVGGINANNQAPADFAYENMQIQCNVIKDCHDFKVKKLLFLGSSCIYPKMAPQPIPENALLTGLLEPTNEGYAIAKISGLLMCRYFKRQYGDNFISCMPTNLYGPYDNYELQGSHVLPAMIRKFHEAKLNGAPSVELWGTGTPLREFLYVDDMADACVFLLENYDGEEHVNIGTGKEVTIKELAELVKQTVGFEGEIIWNKDMPDGTPRKLCDVSKLNSLGFKAKVDLPEGVKLAYEWFKENVSQARGM
jgi:GDP-L-fucose synthase